MRIFEIAREYCGARYCLWENVPGAFSSNNGNDFAYVLGSMVGGGVSVPPDRWKNSGVAISGDGQRLVEWRVLDAQYFGVAQRRRRIFALLDTGAWWSREPILFESESMFGNIEACGSEGEEVAGGVEECFGDGCYAVRTAQTGANRIGVATEKAHTLDGAHEQPIYCGEEL
jgi:DNA (cytosine-5)-methyltransferase 1